MSSNQVVIRISDIFDDNVVSFGPFDPAVGQKVFDLLVEKKQGVLTEVHLDPYASEESDVSVDLD